MISMIVRLTLACLESKMSGSGKLHEYDLFCEACKNSVFSSPLKVFSATTCPEKV